MALSQIEKDTIIDAKFADIEKTAFEGLVQRAAEQVFQNGESEEEMKAILKAIDVEKKALKSSIP